MGNQVTKIVVFAVRLPVLLLPRSSCSLRAGYCSVPRLLHLQSGENSSTYHIGLWRRLGDLIMQVLELYSLSVNDTE